LEVYTARYNVGSKRADINSDALDMGPGNWYKVYTTAMLEQARARQDLESFDTLDDLYEDLGI
jgi:hypothetical protein